MATESYIPVVVLLIAAAAFAVAPLALAWAWAKFFSPQKPGPEKNAIYECGLEAKGGAMPFHPGYILYAIVFLIFDVESIFVLPFAVSYAGLGVKECLAMLVFLLLLIEGLVWACSKRALTWV